jgi:uncharacterized protein (TIGR00255 family)
MTAFGRVEEEIEGNRYVLEVRSLNHRYLDLMIRLPRSLSGWEERIKKTFQARFKRGRMEVILGKNGPEVEGGSGLSVNLTLALEVTRLLKELKEALKLNQEVGLEHLLNFRDLFLIRKEELPDLEVLWHKILPLFQAVLDQVEEMRLREGGNLAADIKACLGAIGDSLKRIGSRREGAALHYRRRLEELLKDRLQGMEREVEPHRLAQEVLFMVDKSDISEELVRFKSHLGQMEDLWNTNQPVGRKMEFMVQEMFREANTIGSKAQDASVSQEVVEIKTALERIREQVQNIE